MYRACGEELQVFLLAMATSPERWVDVPLLVAHAQLLADTHNSVRHYGQHKLLSALHRSYWWPGMHVDIADCIWYCSVCQWDKPPMLPKEELHWMQTKVVHYSSSGALTRWDHFHRMKTKVVTFFSPRIHSPSGWKSVLCPHCKVGCQPSSYTMTWLLAGASHAISGLTMVPSLRAALHGSAKGWALSIIISPLATIRPMGI